MHHGQRDSSFHRFRLRHRGHHGHERSVVQRRHRRRAARVSGLQEGAHHARGDRRLRRALRVLGRGHGDGADGLRADQSVPRAAGGAAGEHGGPDRGNAGDEHRSARHVGLASARCRGGSAAHHAGGSGRLYASGAVAAARPCIGSRRRPDTGGGARSRSDYRRPARQAQALRVLGLSRGVGGATGRAGAEPTEPQAGADHLPARRRRLPRSVGERRVSDVDRRGDPRRPEREADRETADVRGNRRRCCGGSAV